MLGVILLILLGVDWASGYAIAGYCMTHGVSPYGYAFWQSFGPFILLLLIQLIRRDFWLAKSGAIYAVLCGLFGIVIPNLLIYFASIHVPSGLLTILANASPIFTYILAVLFRDEKFSVARFSVVIFGMCGVALIILPNQHLELFGIAHGWLLLALLIPLSYAFSAVYISRFHPGGGNYLSYAMWMLMFATLVNSPLAVIKGGYYPLKLSDLFSWLIIVEIILSTFGYVLLFILIKRVGAVYYTLVNAVAVVAGVGYGYLIFGQQFDWLMSVGGMVIMLAIILLTYLQGNIKKLR